jgi:hypothetical protein
VSIDNKADLSARFDQLAADARAAAGAIKDEASFLAEWPNGRRWHLIAAAAMKSIV